MFFFLYRIATGHAQETMLKGSIEGSHVFKEAVLYQYDIQDIAKGNTVIINGHFDLPLPDVKKPGIYKLVLKDDWAATSFDIVIAPGQELMITVDSTAITFKNSEANSNWYAFLKMEQELLTEIVELRRFLSESDNWEDVGVVEAIQAQNLSIQKLNVLRKKFLLTAGNEWTIGMVQNKPYYFASLRQMPMLRLIEERDHYWDNIATGNPAWINSPLFQYHIQKYMGLLLMGNENEEEVLKIYKRASGLIMAKFSKNEITRKWALDYLTTYFQQQQEVVAHLIERNKLGKIDNEE